MEDIKTFECICRKCAAKFFSTDEQDNEGDGQCAPCKEKTKEIAKQVDEMIAKRRAARGPGYPKFEPENMPGTSYISSRQMLQ